jgi:HEAT repeat protein
MISFVLTALLWAADPASEIVTASDVALDELTRQAAFNRLVEMGNLEIATIINVSQDTTADTRQRWVAIRALGKIKGPQVEQTLLRLLSDKEPAIRTATLGALGDFGSVDNTSMVAKRLEDEAVIVRAAAAEALGKIGDPKGIVFLDKALSSNQNQYRGSSLWVRRSYVEAIGDIADKKGYVPLLRCLRDSDETVVGASIVALEKTTGFSMAEGRERNQEIEAWERWLNNQLR